MKKICALLLSIGLGLTGCAAAPAETPTAGTQASSSESSAPTNAASTGAAPAETPAAGTQASSSESSSPTNAAPASAANEKTKISKAAFDKIENGMTYEEVTGIIGGEGELLSEAGNKGEQHHAVVYMYEGETLGSSASLAFLDGKLQVKSQIGLQ
ncbi:DUF3862 domain-containing protein [Brevibacillus sp. 1238]|uniref:DUF3862 domain-containing protein n=1 Tax=Brevibacillus sp. 1238 TaxID=2940565 RepID=UPI002475C088|nr:DUF3862 domain-containing protein [Brevibacillus sp. 1238]MDH6349499.1 hypothetical protein [Brevibacillus sp. 1238]